MLDKSLPMTGFEPWISGVKGDRSTSEPQPLPTKDILCISGLYSHLVNSIFGVISTFNLA